uniref:Uncharacterized protein n=1 Tax=Panagrolaimus davidi TaxID=227884 RepID=A0A914QA70_9BILA
MIHASEYSETAADIKLSNKSFLYNNINQNQLMAGRPDSDPYGLPIMLWSSYRLCPASDGVQFQIFLSTKKSLCKFTIVQSPKHTIQSQIGGNIQSQVYVFEEHDDEMLTNITIWSNGSVQVLNRETELRCSPNFFAEIPTFVSIRVTESKRCRFAVILQGDEPDTSYEDPDGNMLHNYYIDKNILITTFSVLCAFILALDLAHTVYFIL